MVKLYWSADYQRHWIAYTPETGYVVFPGEEGGWAKRKPFHGLDPLRIREVPVRMAFNTGFPDQSSAKRHSTAA
jgi:hypothetical protein